MKSLKHGKNTSETEVLGISKFGVWIFIEGKEFFLSYDKFPWFREATVDSIYNVTNELGHHLRWPDLDIDLDVESIEQPENFPLVYTEHDK